MPAVPVAARLRVAGGPALARGSVSGRRGAARARRAGLGTGCPGGEPGAPVPPALRGRAQSTRMSQGMQDAISVAPMTLDDLDEVMLIERASFQTPWSRGAFRYELTQNRVARSMVVRVGRQLAGYLCLWEIGHEIHITN